MDSCEVTSNKKLIENDMISNEFDFSSKYHTLKMYLLKGVEPRLCFLKEFLQGQT